MAYLSKVDLSYSYNSFNIISNLNSTLLWDDDYVGFSRYYSILSIYFVIPYINLLSFYDILNWSSFYDYNLISNSSFYDYNLFSNSCNCDAIYCLYLSLNKIESAYNLSIY